MVGAPTSILSDVRFLFNILLNRINSRFKFGGVFMKERAVNFRKSLQGVIRGNVLEIGPSQVAFPTPMAQVRHLLINYHPIFIKNSFEN